MSSLKSICRVGQMSVRQFASAPNKGEIHPRYFEVKELQKLYQKKDGLPIHLKRGATDKAILYVIFGLCGVGLVGVADFFYSLN